MMYVKFDGEKIIAGPQSKRVSDEWVRYIPAEKTNPRQKSTARWDADQNAVVQVLSEEWTPSWREQRFNGYGKIGEQLDKLFHDIENGTLDKSGEFYAHIKSVKDSIPKT